MSASSTGRAARPSRRSPSCVDVQETTTVLCAVTPFPPNRAWPISLSNSGAFTAPGDRHAHPDQGLHHVTAMAKGTPPRTTPSGPDARPARVKQTVNFDEPSVYHLYYGDEVGTPGSVMTYFRSRTLPAASPAAARVGTTVFRFRKARSAGGASG